MSTLYRFLTEDDSSEFCHKVSAALAQGWELYGDPQYTYDHANGVLRCGQGVIKTVGAEYSPDMKLGAQ
ncbi:DUF1737 domain-containing protein [Thalassorhabdomicrobium marinisediminis]|uniref:DUF1737 domain-containing protein n=1 Tax=Thalassorhabdomicrobium marinisediminis TaxID=2170577 RepID=A0A2T7FYG0_9RHOB|nr:DUF1737 domain-containing protein [Thalassorhabdomicrobium marinisediminis]PVA07200.1 hypothetical protein DC363_04935 [Thalassorhabdomicrobium marinisediminis]